MTVHNDVIELFILPTVLIRQLNKMLCIWKLLPFLKYQNFMSNTGCCNF